MNYITWDIVPWIKRMREFFCNGTGKALSYSIE